MIPYTKWTTMDLLYWKKRSSKTEVLHASQMFYKSFLYKMTVYAPGCRSTAYANIRESLSWRLKGTELGYNYAGSWLNKTMLGYLQEADIDQLELISSIRLNSVHYDIKVRVEEPHVDIYAHTEETLKEIAERFENTNCIKSVSGPENDQARALLVDNKILRKRKPKWRYKVLFKDKKYSTENRSAVWNYLDGLNEEIQIPRATKHQLNKHHEWIWGCYFYTNDARIVSMIKLIDPDIVKEVSEMVQIGGK